MDRPLLLPFVLLGCLAWVPCPLAAQQPAEAPSELGELQAALILEKTLQRAIERTEKSVVSIARITRRPFDRQALLERQRQFDPFGGPPAEPDEVQSVPSRYGAGVIISAEGHILTNYHVIDDTFTEDDETFYNGKAVELANQPPRPPAVRDTLLVWTAEPRRYVATVVAADPRSDLAVLKIPARDLPTMPFASVETVDKLRKGQVVVALGNPQAIARDGSASASWGILSNIRRRSAPDLTPEGDEQRLPTELHRFGTLLQTDAKLNYGTSGGALINLRGEMIGLTNALPAVPGYDDAAGFAIPLDAAFRRAVDTLREGREVEYGFLGVNLINPQPLGANPQGVLVTPLRLPPAREAGLRANDLIVAINDSPVRTIEDLSLNIGRLGADAPVRLTVLRGGREIALPAANLMKYPVQGRKIISQLPAISRGIVVDSPTNFRQYAAGGQRGEEFFLQQGCVAVRAIVEGSPAAAANLRREELISHINGEPIRAARDFHEALSAPGPVELRIVGRTEPVTLAEGG